MSDQKVDILPRLRLAASGASAGFDKSDAEKSKLQDTQRAVLNILQDSNAEKSKLWDTQRAVLNILKDSNAEKSKLQDTQRAVLNILKDSNAEKSKLRDAQRAVLNILEDINVENAKVGEANRLLELRTGELDRSNAELEEAREVLEARVVERTAELENSNAQLRAEMEERIKAEEQVKASLKEKETLLKEIHHRVKNNLQIIYSMLNLQLPQVKDTESIGLFKESQNRVYTMALIHEKLYQSESISKIDLPEYLRSLAANLFSSYSVGGGRIRSRIEVEKIALDIDTMIPCALIVNELVSNSLKHAFPPSRLAQGNGEICIGLRRDTEGNLELQVADDGIGLPPGFDIRNCRTMGLKLVSVLAKQLKAAIQISPDGGTRFVITGRQKDGTEKE